MHCNNQLSTSLVPVVHIADSAPGDYEQLNAELDSTETKLKFFTTANAAICHARQGDRSRGGNLWFVNGQLPEMSGTELVAILREIFGQAALVMVGDQYNKQQEIAAVVAGASMYVCKPVCSALVANLCGSLRLEPDIPSLAAERASAHQPRSP